jgi:hypothetical protein
MPDVPAPAPAPSTGAWKPGPPPPPSSARRRGPTVIALVLAVLVLVGAAAAWGLRASVGSGDGAGSPEAAAQQLVQALADQDLDRAVELVNGVESRALEVYGDQLTGLLTDRLELGGQSGRPTDLTATDVRFRQVAGSGDIAVVELSGGTFGANGLELNAGQVNQRVSEATDGRMDAVRLVALRDGGRWRVGVLASMANAILTSAGVGPADPAVLLSGPTADGAADPKAAVRAVLDRLADGDASGAVARLVPDEARVVGGARAAAAAAPPPPGAPANWPDEWLSGRLPGGGLRIEGLGLREEQIADVVVRVTVTGRVAPPGQQPEPLPAEGVAVVVLRDGDLWYPSLVFTAVDQALRD